MVVVFLSLSVVVAGPVGFDGDVRPILSDNCFRCHGPGQKSRKTKSRLDVREVAVEKRRDRSGPEWITTLLW